MMLNELQFAHEEQAAYTTGYNTLFDLEVEMPLVVSAGHTERRIIIR
jgi:hypothetical protein